MKKVMKKVVSLLLALFIACGSIGNVSASAAYESETIGGIEDGLDVLERCPLRSGPGKDYPVQCYAESGAVLAKEKAVLNSYLHKWYKVTVGENSYYVYSEHVRSHTHSYKPYGNGDYTIKVCACGKCVIEARTKETCKVLKSGLAVALPAAGTLAVVDGPLPVGELIGAFVIAVAVVADATGVIPQAEDTITIEIVKELKLIDYLNRDDGVCGPASFRAVGRAPGNLVYVGTSCFNALEAYALVNYVGVDVYNQNAEMALLLADLSENGWVMEHDKDQVTHYWHYHFLNPNGGRVKGHVFYGTNDLGMTPS